MKIPRSLLLCCLVVCALLGCGGGGNSSVADTGLKNFVSIKVDKGVNGDYLNGLFTKVTICSVALNNCAEVDNILVDTGSTGLRLIASAIPNDLILNYVGSDGFSVAECTQFVSGVIWGPIANADVKIGGELAKNIPIQLAGVSGFNAVPSDCSSKGQLQNTVQTLSANGVLGISNFVNDCGIFCVNNSNNSYYYICDSKGCQNSVLTEAKQVQNPVAHFQKNNNGTVISLPGLSTRSASVVEGKLIFGINTELNNQLNDAKRVSLNSTTATFSTIYKNHDYALSYFDSGSNGIYFDDSSINQCADTFYIGYYCPGLSISIDVIFKGVGQEIYGYTFNGADTLSILKNPQFLPVQPHLIGPSTGSFQDFVWGLPFFYGKDFFTAIENKELTANGIFSAYK